MQRRGPSLHLLLDLWDWIHVFGFDPVTPAAWAFRFRPGVKHNSNRRNWLRILGHLKAYGIPHERVDGWIDPHSLQPYGCVTAIRLTPETHADVWARIDELEEQKRKRAADRQRKAAERLTAYREQRRAS